MEGRQQELIEAIRSPDLVQEGDFGALMAVKSCDGLYLVVIYRELGPDDGFVITAYLTNRLRGRETIWRR